MTHPPQGEAAPAAKNHQEIVDALDGMDAEFTAAYRAASAHVEARRAELQKQCGELGHLFAKDRASLSFGKVRFCVYCGAAEATEVTHG